MMNTTTTYNITHITVLLVVVVAAVAVLVVGRLSLLPSVGW